MVRDMAVAATKLAAKSATLGKKVYGPKRMKHRIEQ